MRALLEAAVIPLYAIIDLALDAPGALVILAAALGLFALSR